MSKGQGSQLEGANSVTSEDQHNGSIQDSGTETPPGKHRPPTQTVVGLHLRNRGHLHHVLHDFLQPGTPAQGWWHKGRTCMATKIGQSKNPGSCQGPHLPSLS